MGYFTDKRIRFFISALTCLMCGAGAFIPAINIADPLGFSPAETHSVMWFLKEANFPELYTVTLVLYFALILPIIVCGFLTPLKKWPVVVAAVASCLYFLINVFWAAIILWGGSGGFVTLNLWGWGYLVLQIITIINLFAFLPSLKK
jgi:hypothetical protein